MVCDGFYSFGVWWYVGCINLLWCLFVGCCGCVKCELCVWFCILFLYVSEMRVGVFFSWGGFSVGVSCFCLLIGGFWFCGLLFWLLG